MKEPQPLFNENKYFLKLTFDGGPQYVPSFCTRGEIPIADLTIAIVSQMFHW